MEIIGRFKIDRGYYLFLLVLAFAFAGGMNCEPRHTDAPCAETSLLPQDRERFWNVLKQDRNLSPDAVARIQRWSTAHSQDPEAKFMFAVLARENLIEPASPALWLTALREAAEKGYAPAQATWGVVLLGNSDVTPDPVLGRLWIEKGIAQGDGLAFLHAGAAYRTGNVGFPKDVKRASIFFQKAADAGYIDGQIGELETRADQGDFAGAIGPMTRLARAGNPFAQGILALWYLKGQGVSKDANQGFHWMSTAVESSHRRNGQFLDILARLYYSGLGVPVDTDKAITLFEEAYRDHCHAAGFMLATIYFSNLPEKNADRGAKILRELANVGDHKAQLDLGRRMLTADEISADQTEGRHLIEGAALQGDEDAIAVLESIAPQQAAMLLTKGSVVASFDIDNWGQMLTIPVWHNGKVCCFIVDTGAAINGVDSKEFPDLTATGMTADVATHNGHVTDPIFLAPKLVVGPFDLSRCGPVVQWDFSKMNLPTRLPCIGVLGLPALRQFVLQIDYDNSKMLCLKPDDHQHPDWGTQIPLNNYNEGTPEAVIAMNGKEENVIFDTGVAEDGFLTEELFSQMVASTTQPITTPMLASPSGLRQRRCMQVPIISLGGVKYRDLEFTESQIDGAGFGLYFIERHLATFDFPHSRLYLKPGREFYRKSELGHS